VNKTIKKYSYYLRYGCDIDNIGFEAQAHGCECLTGSGRVVVAIWETNPYNSWFALKYSDNVIAVKNEDWYI
jgi:hypothetical protein